LTSPERCDSIAIACERPRVAPVAWPVQADSRSRQESNLMRTSTLFALIVLTLCLTGRTRAAIIHVPADSATIQAGIDGAAPGDTVMVAPGRYVVYWLEWHGKGVTVMSTDPLDSVVVAATVIDGDSLDPVVYFNEGEDSTAVLTGFTITGGYASSFGLGGGILCAGSSPTISHNVITDNHVEDGGGIGCTLYSDPIIRENIIVGNSASTTTLSPDTATCGVWAGITATFRLWTT